MMEPSQLVSIAPSEWQPGKLELDIRTTGSSSMMTAHTIEELAEISRFIHEWIDTNG